MMNTKYTMTLEPLQRRTARIPNAAVAALLKIILANEGSLRRQSGERREAMWM